MFEYKKVKCCFCVTKNQTQVHKNCSVDDFKIYMIQTSLVTLKIMTYTDRVTFLSSLALFRGGVKHKGTTVPDEKNKAKPQPC